MTGQGNGKPILFKIVISAAVSQQALKKYKKPFTRAMPTFSGSPGSGRLPPAPLGEAREFGEEFLNYPALQLQARKGLIRPILIEYAVHHVEPILYGDESCLFDRPLASKSNQVQQGDTMSTLPP